MCINLPPNDYNEILILSGNIQNTLHSLHEISATAPSHNSKNPLSHLYTPDHFQIADSYLSVNA